MAERKKAKKRQNERTNERASAGVRTTDRPTPTPRLRACDDAAVPPWCKSAEYKSELVRRLACAPRRRWVRKQKNTALLYQCPRNGQETERIRRYHTTDAAMPCHVLWIFQVRRARAGRMREHRL